MSTISKFIARDLAERLRAPLPADELTLHRLAAHYRVSPTPVRQAVRVLLGEGVLRRDENGRLAVGNALPYESASASLPASADWESDLVQEILRRSLTGSGGDYLREEAMARRFGVGRTVLRQAFSRLAGKGLLEHVPRCGWRVRTFDEADLEAYLVAREALELTALDLARDRLDPDELRAMLENNTAAHLDNRLHRYWIDRADNPYIRDFFDRHGLYYTALFDFAAPEADVLSEMADQHRAILTALLDRDWEQAKRALADHIRSQRPIVKRLLARLL